ncbi:MAG: hypothetical protein IJB53_06630, partial [Mailhella sp.]|nr:hypothetical protein [Mailhella sp.]
LLGKLTIKPLYLSSRNMISQGMHFGLDRTAITGQLFVFLIELTSPVLRENYLEDSYEQSSSERRQD